MISTQWSHSIARARWHLFPNTSNAKESSRVKYLDPRMEAILKPTYGILIYQDDVMMIAVQLAGYSWGEADKFRKAMGKKIPEEMAAQKEKFQAAASSTA
jgi:DNA polymerase-3 subunit alpha